MRQVFAAFAMSGTRTTTGFRARQDRGRTGAPARLPARRTRPQGAANGDSGKR